MPRGPRVPLFASEAPRPLSQGQWRPRYSAIEMAPVLHLLKETLEEKTKTEETQPMPTRSASTALRQGRKPRKTPSCATPKPAEPEPIGVVYSSPLGVSSGG